MFAFGEDRTAHDCPRCKRKQPNHVMWRGEPCGQCKKELQFPGAGQ
jgi:hypothetical protein